MKCTVLRSVSEIEPGEWNSIVGRNRLICRHEYLRAIERSRINDCRYFYPVIHDNGELVAHACLYYISTELDTFAQGLVKKAITGARKAWKNFLVLRSVECGTPVALGSTISFRDGYMNRASALREIVRATESLAAEMKVGVVLFRDFYDREIRFYDLLRDCGYRRIHNLPSAELEVRWKDFEEYLDSMRSEYRKKIVARMRIFRESGGSIETVRDHSVYADDFARLWKNVYERAKEYRREVLVREFFESIASCLPARSAAIVAKVKGRMAGYFLVLFDDDTLIPLFCGLDYARTRDSFVYFNLYYAAVRLAIERQARNIDFGITALVPKLDLGARVVPLNMYMKHLNPLLGRAVPALFEKMTPKCEVNPRKVFKRTA